MKRLVVIALTLTMLLSVACAAAETTEYSKEFSGTTLTMAGWQPEYPEFWAKFEEDTGIKIAYEMISSDQYLNIINTRLLAGEAPDIFAPRYFDTYEQIVAEGRVVDLSNEPFIDLLSDGAKAQIKASDGKYYSVPESQLKVCMFYNKDMFANYNLSVPTNWSEFLSVCQTLQDAGEVPYIQGMQDLWQCKYIGVDPMYRLSAQDPKFSAKMLTGETSFEDPQILEAYQKTEEFIKAGYVHEASIGLTFIEAWQMFCNGEAAMMSGGTWYSAQAFPEAEPTFTVGAAPMPLNYEGEEQFVIVGATSDMFCINAAGKNQGAALEYFQWWCDHMDLYATYASHMIATKGETPAFSPESYIYDELNGYKEAIFQKEPSAVSTDYGKVMQDLFLGNTDSATIVDYLQTKLNDSLGK